jgi:hypothetical protein
MFIHFISKYMILNFYWHKNKQQIIQICILNSGSNYPSKETRRAIWELIQVPLSWVPVALQRTPEPKCLKNRTTTDSGINNDWNN